MVTLGADADEAPVRKLSRRPSIAGVPVSGSSSTTA
jgi:hypothetical protein